MKTLFALWFAWLACGPLRGEEAATHSASNSVPYPVVDLPFPVGETLEYRIYWGWISVGSSTATTRWEWRDDRWMLVIRFRTLSNSVIEKIYPVNDTIESVIDPDTLRPVSFLKILNEGRHHTDEFTTFDWDKMEANFRQIRKGKTTHKTYAIRENTKDLVSFMYFMRQTDFQPRSSYQFEVMADEKLYDLEVKSGKLENVKTQRHGKIKSLKLEPQASFEGIFVRKGTMTLYVSNDPRRIVTRLVADTPFANVRLVLRKVSGPGSDFWVEGQGGDDTDEDETLEE